MLSGIIVFPDFLLSLIDTDTFVRNSIAFGVFLITIAVIVPLRSTIMARISGYAPVSRDIARIIAGVLSPWSLVVFLIPIPLLIAVVPPTIGRFVWIAIFLFAVLEASRILTGLIDYSLSRFTPKQSKHHEHSRFSILLFLIRVSLFSFATLFALSNLGINVGPLLASFGVAGIVIGFGMQNILSDLFATLVIELDRPFDAGDTIAVGADTGVVERVNLRSTRIRALTGELVIIPNRDITASRVRNISSSKIHTIVYTIPVEGAKIDMVEHLASDLVTTLTIDKKSPVTVRLRCVRENAYEYEVMTDKAADIVTLRGRIVSEVVRACERDGMMVRSIMAG